MTDIKLQQAQQLKKQLEQIESLTDEDYINIGLVTYDDDARIDRFDNVCNPEPELQDEWKQDILYKILKELKELYIKRMNEEKIAIQREFDEL